MPWARASELDRLIACPAAGHLPRDPDTPGDAAVWGTLMHKWKETGKWWEDSLVTRRRAAALLTSEWGSREALWPSDGRHEVAYALATEAPPDLDVWRGPLDGTKDGWKQGHGGLWAVGTADYVGDILGDVWVDDLKTGTHVPEDPWDLWQLRFYALCALLERPDSQWVHLSITHWLRYPADGEPRRYFTTPRSREEVLTTVLPVLDRTRRAVAESRLALVPDTSRGPHCTYCRAINNCPAWNGEPA